MVDPVAERRKNQRRTPSRGLDDCSRVMTSRFFSLSLIVISVGGHHNIWYYNTVIVGFIGKCDWLSGVLVKTYK